MNQTLQPSRGLNLDTVVVHIETYRSFDLRKAVRFHTGYASRHMNCPNATNGMTIRGMRK
jgi:hypothetical protein